MLQSQRGLRGLARAGGILVFIHWALLLDLILNLGCSASPIFSSQSVELVVDFWEASCKLSANYRRKWVGV